MAPATTYSTLHPPKVALPPIDARQREPEMAPEVASGNRAVTVVAQEKDENHTGEETRITLATTHHGPTPSVEFDDIALSTVFASIRIRRFDRFPALSKIIPEPQQERLLQRRRSGNEVRALNGLASAIVEAIPASPSTPPATLTPGPFPHSHIPPISSPTISTNTSPSALDPLPELPWLPLVVVGLMIVFSALGFTFVALTYLVHFPLQKGYFYNLCVKLRIVPRFHEHDDHEDFSSDSTYQSGSESTSGTSYRLSPLSPNSPIPTAFSASNLPAFLDSTSAACAYESIAPQQTSARRRRLPPTPLNLFVPRIPTTRFVQRTASPRTPYDEESLTPRSPTLSSVLDPLRNIPPLSAVLSGSGSLMGSAASEALLGSSEGMQQRNLGRQGCGGGKSLVEKLECVVDKIADGLVRYVKDEAGDEGLLLPVTVEERGGWEAFEEVVGDCNQ